MRRTANARFQDANEQNREGDERRKINKNENVAFFPIVRNTRE